MFDRVRLWARSMVMRRRLEREMQDEMAWHLDQSAARLVARGMSPREARRAALREFGNVGNLQEEARDARGARWVDSLRADVRFALRHFARTPWTTATMLLVLIAGMVISALLFTYVHAYATLPPQGIERTDDLVRIRGTRDAGAYGRSHRTFSEEEFLAYRGLTGHFAAVAGWTDATMGIAVGGGSARGVVTARVSFVTGTYFPVLGVRPALGPGLPTGASEDPSQTAVAVISHLAWLDLFGGSPDAIGSSLLVKGMPVTIVGVAPERFIGFPGFQRLELWMPLAARRALVPDSPGGFRAVARLREGVSMHAASAAVAAVAARSAEAEGRAASATRAANGDTEVRSPAVLDPSTDVVPLLAANSDPMFDRDVRMMTVALGLLALLILLVTCTNVSALLTGLAAARRHEVAVRLSLGAARPRLIRQLLTESALLASLAAAVALGIVWMGLSAIRRFIPLLPFDVGLTWPAITFTFGIALAVGVLFGLSPALHATRLGLASALRDSTGTTAAARARLQRGLVAAQIAFTQPLIVLLAAVLLLVLGNNWPQARTANAERLVTIGLGFGTPVTTANPDTAAVRRQLQERRTAMSAIRERLERTPGIEMAVVDWGGGSLVGRYAVHDRDAAPGATRELAPLVGYEATKSYLDAMAVPLVRGRHFEPGDMGAVLPGTTGDVPAIIGTDLARRMWGGADPIGLRLQPVSDTVRGGRTLVVVGVIEDPKAETRKAGQDYRVYLPPDTTWSPSAVLVRTVNVATTMIPTIREVVQETHPDLPARIRTIAEIESETLRHFRLATSGILAAGLAALLLSAIGLYAVVAFSVNQRTKEIAVRMAVGARGRQIARRFVADGLRLSGIGLAIGLPASLVGLRALIEFAETDAVAIPQVAVIAAVAVTLVAVLAAWLPARRAAAVEPAVALRSE